MKLVLMIRKIMLFYPILLGFNPFIDNGGNYVVTKYSCHCMQFYVTACRPWNPCPQTGRVSEPPQTHLHRATVFALLVEEALCQTSGIAAVATVLPVRKQNYLHKEVKRKTHTPFLEHRHRDSPK